MPIEPEKPTDNSPERTQSRWRPGEPLPWAKFDWRKWLSSPHVSRLTLEQQARFLRVWASTHGTMPPETPGIMTEEDVRLWCGYTLAAWKRVRGRFQTLFDTETDPGKWILTDVVTTWRETCERAQVAIERAKKASSAAARKRGSTDDGGPESWPQGDLAGVLEGTLEDTSKDTSKVAGMGRPATLEDTSKDTSKVSERGRPETSKETSKDPPELPELPEAPELPDVPELSEPEIGRSAERQSWQNGSGGLASARTGDTTAGHAALLARALGAGPATGTDGTDAARGGGA